MTHLLGVRLGSDVEADKRNTGDAGATEKKPFVSEDEKEGATGLNDPDRFPFGDGFPTFLTSLKAESFILKMAKFPTERSLFNYLRLTSAPNWKFIFWNSGNGQRPSSNFHRTPLLTVN
ncbi:hypothetical protein RUM43_006056 [Polyplax serrata]|uniref:Uncharacterized protein n=1 Tax=Polyplax serrata TaxID=468196 RepID=A0AAN8NRB9_POLSC